MIGYYIVAGWSRELYEPAWLQPHPEKTSYVGGISRFDGRGRPLGERSTVPSVPVLGGAGGGDLDVDVVQTWADAVPEFGWRTLALPGGRWSSDPWPDICAADVVVTHAGQGCVARHRGRSPYCGDRPCAATVRRTACDGGNAAQPSARGGRRRLARPPLLAGSDRPGARQ